MSIDDLIAAVEGRASRPQAADTIILARLTDILAAHPDREVRLNFPIGLRAAGALDAWTERDDSLRAMGWFDLTDEERAVLAGSCRDGTPPEAIGRVLGVSRSTAYRLRQRALDKLYVALSDDEMLARLGPVPRSKYIWYPAAPRPYIPFPLRVAVYRRDGFACLHCGAAQRLTLDHIYPFSKGGPDTYENLQTLCLRCNIRKGARVPVDSSVP